MSAERPKVLFVLYYQSPPHTDDLIFRAEHELVSNNLLYQRYEATGPPATTLNEFLDINDYHPDWVVAFDPHFQWIQRGHTTALDVLHHLPSPHSTGAVCYPCVQHGPQDQWKNYLGDIPTPPMRLLCTFNVHALQAIGGFKGAESGRNWLMATIMALEDQGYTTEYPRMAPIARHVDPDLSMSYFLRQRFMSGRDMGQLWMANKGHPHFQPDTLQRMALLQGLPRANIDRLVYRTLEGVWLLGALQGLGWIPQSTIPGGRIEFVKEAIE